MVGVASGQFFISIPLLQFSDVSFFLAGMKETRTQRFTLPSCNSILKYTSCNKHLLGLGQQVKASLVNSRIIGYQFGTVGVSDGISMGTYGMTYSLQSRYLIADQVETAAGGHHLDGMVVVPGCDKNMPGVLMARQCFSIFPISSIGTSIHVYFKLDNSGTPESSRFDGVRRLHPSGLV